MKKKLWPADKPLPASVVTLADEERFYDRHEIVYRESEWFTDLGRPPRTVKAPETQFRPAAKDVASLKRLAKRRGKEPAKVFSELVRAALRSSAGSR